MNADVILQKKEEKFKKLNSGERHNKLYGLAVAAYYAGYDTHESLRTYLLSVYDQCSGMADAADVESTTKKIIANAGGEISASIKATNITTKVTKDIFNLAAKHKNLWQKWCTEILTKPLSISDCGNFGKKELDAMQVEAVEAIVGDMTDAYFFIGNKYSDKDSYSYVTKGYNTSRLDGAPLFCPNPLTAKSRKKANCKHVHHLVLEMDDVLKPLTAEANTAAGMDEAMKQQLHLWTHLMPKLPVRSLIYSGNKSIHAIIAVDTTLEELEHKRQELAAAYAELHFDIANIDAVRKTRMPFGVRYFVQGEDGALIDYDTAQNLSKIASGYGDEAKDARDKLKNLKIDTKNIKCVGRLQDCYYYNPQIEAISLNEFIQKLKNIANEFLPTSANIFEQALERHDTLPMTQQNFDAYLQYKNYKIYTDDITRLPVFKGFAVNNPNSIANQILDDWYSLSEKFPPVEKVKLCINQTLASNHVNSVAEWLATIQWDGHSRLPDIYSILHLADDFSKILVKKWLIQCVAMVENGENNPYGIDGVLTLIGKQGDGKTSFFRKLIPCAKQKDWFAEGRALDTENVDSKRQLTKGWIMELGEVDSTTKKEQSSLKALLTASVDEIRRPYQEYADTTYRHVSVCASVNKEEYLRDETGNRRWWSVKISVPIDLAAMSELDIAQLWAEVKNIWDNSDKIKQDAFRLNYDERLQLEEINSCQREDAGYEEMIKNKFDFAKPTETWERLTLEQICEKLFPYSLKVPEKRMLSRSLEALKIEITRPHNKKHYMMPPINNH